jgi:hypothetical protein
MFEIGVNPIAEIARTLQYWPAGGGGVLDKCRLQHDAERYSLAATDFRQGKAGELVQNKRYLH